MTPNSGDKPIIIRFGRVLNKSEMKLFCDKQLSFFEVSNHGTVLNSIAN